MKNNIILIGMPAAGKSTLGVLLAKVLGKKFIDTDLLIQEKENMLLQSIINEKGLEEFKKIEEKTILESELDNAIISTGGSVVYYQSVMERLRKKGTIIYLALGYETIEERLNNIHTRGLVLEKGYSLRDLYNERLPLYKKYEDMTVDCEGLDVEENVEKIIDLLEEQND